MSWEGPSSLLRKTSLFNHLMVWQIWARSPSSVPFWGRMKTFHQTMRSMYPFTSNLKQYHSHYPGLLLSIIVLILSTYSWSHITSDLRWWHCSSQFWFSALMVSCPYFTSQSDSRVIVAMIGEKNYWYDYSIVTMVVFYCSIDFSVCRSQKVHTWISYCLEPSHIQWYTLVVPLRFPEGKHKHWLAQAQDCQNQTLILSLSSLQIHYLASFLALKKYKSITQHPPRWEESNLGL